MLRTVGKEVVVSLALELAKRTLVILALGCFVAGLAVATLLVEVVLVMVVRFVALVELVAPEVRLEADACVAAGADISLTAVLLAAFPLQAVSF